MPGRLSEELAASRSGISEGRVTVRLVEEDVRIVM
jgi:hypothetical protein